MIENRYEIKFTFPINQVNQIKAYIKSSNLGFLKVFNDRKISSIYLDRENYNYGFENICGFSERKKFRYRFYDDDMKKIRFEIKYKKGSIYEKRFFNLLEPYSYSYYRNPLLKIFKGKKEMLDIINLKPVLLCSYYREYFVSNCKRFRVTLDSKIGFSKIIPIYSFDQILNQLQIINNGVLELKTSVENIYFSENIFDNFPLRVSKHSKYEIGLSKTNCINPKNFI